MTKKTLSAAILGVVTALALAACTSPVDTTTPAPSSSPATGDVPEAPVVVDRSPQGPLPDVAFDADGVPELTPVDADPPTVISVQTLAAGTGVTIGENDFLTVHYSGFLWSDGSQFDSSYETGEPAGFLLQETLDGWVYALPGARVGDRLLLVIPPEYGYGDLEDDAIPPGSTLVFVVDILDALSVNTDALAEATPTGAALPEGLSISGALGQEPVLVFAEAAPQPTEAEIIVIAVGNGAAITEDDTLLYHVAGAVWGEPSSSSWSGSFEQAEFGGGEETIGQSVGSRLLLVYPADEESGVEAEAIVLDLMAVVPGQ